MRVNIASLVKNDKGLPVIDIVKTKNTKVKNCISAENIAVLMREIYKVDKKTEEYAFLICLSVTMKVIAIFEISHGGMDSTMIGSKEVLQRCLMCGATNAIIVHNHPSGDIRPSLEDELCTYRLKNAMSALDIRLVDHVIVAGDGHYSFLANKIL